ncbi:hypothetical protein KP005_04955 [Geomonas nitrogeniifigens]|uniref:Cthe-2314-like HEPN domain-containing protein n=1 Tax=Geomonas diazotrophica TaxID=2843197 RepID=A0ABX8JLU2_9BACT|nr:hypothetical protein [Geomonas nitrogeniifigens]QWV98639.1 hypothetical protein KP005_04955 [Geomonas nitrogeniifigens]
MEKFDVVIEQIIDSSKSKKVALAIAERVKHILVHAMPEGYEEIDIDLDTLIYTISYVRNNIKKWNTLDGDYKVLKRMLELQKMFYMMSDSYDPHQSISYKKYIDNYEIIYNELCQNLSELDAFKFMFNANLGRPLATSILEIDKYHDALKIAVKSLYKLLVDEVLQEVKGLGPFLKFHNEVVGAEDAWSKTLDEWVVYGKIYASIKVARKSKAETIREIMKGSSEKPVFFNINDMDNATHKLDGHLAEAEALVASAVAGTFPY